RWRCQAAWAAFAASDPWAITHSRPCMCPTACQPSPRSTTSSSSPSRRNESLISSSPLAASMPRDRSMPPAYPRSVVPNPGLPRRGPGHDVRVDALHATTALLDVMNRRTGEDEYPQPPGPAPDPPEPAGPGAPPPSGPPPHPEPPQPDADTGADAPHRQTDVH